MWILWQIGIFISTIVVADIRYDKKFELHNFVSFAWMVETFIMLNFFSPLQIIQVFVVVISWNIAERRARINELKYSDDK